MNISTHADFLENKDELEAALYKVMYDILSKMSLEELKKISWFSSKAYESIPPCQ